MSKIINVISVLLATLGLLIECIPNLYLEIEIELLMFAIPGLLVFINMMHKLKKANNSEEKEYIQKISFSYLFYIYILAIISLVFLNNSYRLPYISKNHSLPLFSAENIEKNTSIVPFKFMIDMINRYSNGIITLKTLIYNIIGNFLLFAPMGVFIPILFKSKIKTLKSYTLLMLIIIISVELLQFFLQIGQADIDDVFLNLAGAVISYILYNKIKKKVE